MFPLGCWKMFIQISIEALKDGQSWLDSNPEADAEEIKEKHKEIEGICAAQH
jgi:hypothetical protein